MSTHRHIDKICIAAIAFAIVFALLFANGESFGITASAREIGYESRIFDRTRVHTIDIVMDDWDSFISTCTNEEYSTCAVVIDGEAYRNIAIRAKGNTSLSSVKSMNSERYSFKIEFDHYDNNTTYYGLDKLCLNNVIQDNTYMKDYIAYTMMYEFGVAAPLCSFAYITVNGEDWGLYLAVEAVEDSFMVRNYNSAGELYKPDGMNMGGGRGNGKDFKMEDLEGFEDFFGNRGENDSNTLGKFPSMGNSGTTNRPNNGDWGTTNRPNNGDWGTTNRPNTGNSGTTNRPSTGNSNKGNMPNMGDFDMSNMPNMGDFDMSNIPNMGDFDMSNIPNMGDFDMSNIPNMGDFDMSNMPNMGDFDMSNMPNMGENFQQGGNRPNMGGFGGFGGFGMGGSDVKLRYIDDNPSSYSNIFSSAKTKLSDADKTRLIASLKSLSSYENIESVVDVEQVISYFVVHNFVDNGDSYTGSMIHNYYLHEEDGALSMIPWDYNLAYGTFRSSNATGSVNSPIDTPVSGSVDDRPMIGWIFSDESYTELYHQYFNAFIEQFFDSGWLEGLIDDTVALISPYVEKDPTKFCTYEEFLLGAETIKSYCLLRAESVRGQLDGTIPSTSSGQSADSSMLVATDGLNLKSMGSMSMGGGGAGKFPRG